MKRFLNFIAAFLMVLAGGVLFSACCDNGDNKEYEYHIPSNLEQYGIVNIYTSSGYIKKSDKNIYFRFMARYSYDPDTLKVHFKDNDGNDVAVSDFVFDSYDEGEYEKTYHVTLKKAKEITITLEGKAKIETKNFQIDSTITNGGGTLNNDNLAKLRLNIEVNGTSTGDMTYQEFSEMLTTQENGNNLVLKESQELDYGSQIKVSIWSEDNLNTFRNALIFKINNELYGDEYANWEHVIIEENGKKILKNTAILSLEEDFKLGFSINDDYFEEAKFDQLREYILPVGYLYYFNDEYYGKPFQVFGAQNNKIETLADLLKEQTVTLKLDGGTEEDSPIGYIVKKVKEGRYKNFSISSSGSPLSNFTVDYEEEEGELNSTNYRLVFKNVPVRFPNGTKLYADLTRNLRIELFKVTWNDFSRAMSENFVEVPINCDYNEVTSNYVLNQGIREADLRFPATSLTEYCLNEQEFDYYFYFNNAAIGKTFKISIGNESRNITITNSGEVEQFSFCDGKISLTFDPQAVLKEQTAPRIIATGLAKDFISPLKIEFVS